jgi:hypothetical protein
MVVVDGRAARAAGMSLEELQQILKWIRHMNAVNLDGGGSSTLCVRKMQPYRFKRSIIPRTISSSTRWEQDVLPCDCSKMIKDCTLIQGQSTQPHFVAVLQYIFSGHLPDDRNGGMIQAKNTYIR